VSESLAGSLSASDPEENLVKSIVRPLVLLVLMTFLPSDAQAPRKTCDDPVPKDCTKVKFLGEDDECACFVCNPDAKTRKVVCTKDETAKKALYKLRDASKEASAQASGAAR
jgi:hypothetical protein